MTGDPFDFFCSDSNSGHCGYQFEPREPARWEFLKNISFLIDKLQNFLTYFLLPFFTSKYLIFSLKLLQ